MSVHVIYGLKRSTLPWTSWSWSHGSWISNYMCNQCISPLMMWVRASVRRIVHDTILC